MFSIKATQRKTQLTVKIDGALTVYGAADAVEQLRRLENLGQKLVCDLSELNELDTAGLQLLLSLAKTTTEKGGEFVVSKANASFTNLTTLFALSHAFSLSEQ